MTEENNTDDKKVENIEQVANKIRPRELNDTAGFYSLDIKEKLKYFLYAYDFLYRTKENMTNKKSTDVIKITNILNNLKECYIEGQNLMYFLNSDRYYGRSKVELTTINLFRDNVDNINKLLIFVYALGKRVTEYDPEEHGGLIQY